MMKKLRVIVGLLLLAAIGVVHAEQEGVTFFNEADEAKAITIKYRGAATATITNAATTIELVDDDYTNSIAIGTTMSAVLTSINAATNTAGIRNFTSDYLCSLSTDSLSNKLVAATAQVDISDGKEVQFLTMDTSATVTFDVARKDGPACWVTGITGNPGGTGNATTTIYVDGDMKWTDISISPCYDNVDGTIFSTNANVNLSGTFNESIYVGKDRTVLVRSTRATTATTGGIGVIFTQR